MRIRIDDVNKGTFRLPESFDNREGTLKIGIKSIGCWVGFYNIYEKHRCRYGSSGESGTDFYIEPGLYNFKEISKDLRKAVKRLSLSLDKITGLVDLTIPDGVILWLPEPVKYILGIDDEGWLQGAYTGDRPVEFLPAGGINIYLDKVATTKSLSTSKSGNIISSNLLGNIPMLSENFGQYVYLHYDNPIFVDLTAGNIDQLEFRLKIQWGNSVQHKLNNHSLPISLELEIK